MHNIIPMDDLLTLAGNYPLLEEARSRIKFERPHYSRQRISRTDNLEVVLVCFADYQSTSVHDHGGSQCVIRCLSGEAHETVYEEDKKGNLSLWSNGLIREGDLKSIHPNHYHQIANLSTRGTVFLNFYSPPLPQREEGMSEEEIKALVGLSMYEAESKVYCAGMEAHVYLDSDFRADIATPNNVVVLNHDETGMVTSAYTQEMIENNYEGS